MQTRQGEAKQKHQWESDKKGSRTGIVNDVKQEEVAWGFLAASNMTIALSSKDALLSSITLAEFQRLLLSPKRVVSMSTYIDAVIQLVSRALALYRNSRWLVSLDLVPWPVFTSTPSYSSSFCTSLVPVSRMKQSPCCWFVRFVPVFRDQWRPPYSDRHGFWKKMPFMNGLSRFTVVCSCHQGQKKSSGKELLLFNNFFIVESRRLL